MRERIIEVVKEAGKLVLEFETKIESIEITSKEGEGLATQADVEVENFLIKKLNQIQKAEILAEESFFKSEHKDYSFYKDKLTWVIDPIDGTNNFINSIPFYSICVALVDKGVVQFGIVFNPKNGECFVAEKGKGVEYSSFYSSSVASKFKSENKRVLTNSLVSLGLVSSKSAKANQDGSYYKSMLKQTRAVRKFGSAALDMCYVAIDRLDVFQEYSLKPWDIAAASLVCREAGVKLTDHDGQELGVFDSEVFAAKEPLYSDTMNFIRGIK